MRKPLLKPKMPEKIKIYLIELEKIFFVGVEKKLEYSFDVKTSYLLIYGVFRSYLQQPTRCYMHNIYWGGPQRAMGILRIFNDFQPGDVLGPNPHFSKISKNLHIFANNRWNHNFQGKYRFYVRRNNVWSFDLWCFHSIWSTANIISNLIYDFYLKNSSFFFLENSKIFEKVK